MPGCTPGRIRTWKVIRRTPGAPLTAPGTFQVPHTGNRLLPVGSTYSTRALLPSKPVVDRYRNPPGRLTDAATPLATADPTLATVMTYVAVPPVTTWPVAAAVA